ncbi:RDD family protein [Flavobacterium sp.]|uniref:RDD family protein n=1 Tax=Flavobacterium sp. TaxID=239 RepID=UPI00263959C0|nr:RDD family protein [Flavobacterium sp.]
MKNRILPIYKENSYQSLYGNFGERFAALLLDGLILSPLTIIILLLNNQNLYYAYFTGPLALLLNFVYHIVLPVHYGATPGKLAMGLFILKTDGGYIGYKEAFLKLVPLIIITIIAQIFSFYGISQADATTFNDMGWFDKQQYLQSFYPFFGRTVIVILPNVLYFSSLILFLLNDRKRSLTDMIAGTVVVHKRNLDWIEEYRKKEVSNTSSHNTSISE